MRILFPFLLAGLLPFTMLQAQETTSQPLNVLTFNIRYDNAQDGPNGWTHRKEMVAAVLAEQHVDLAGLQEVLVNQLDDLQRLRPEYGFVGVGREDGQRKGEFAPIFYRKDALTCEKSGTFWLSPTPEVVGSKGWDAALARIATWGIFRDQRTGKELFFVNTHFDHRGEEARRESARLLIERCATLGEGRPVILTGDFNTTEETEAIRTLTSDSRLKLVNSAQVSETPHEGGQASFNGFRSKKPEEVIDFIFVGPGWEVRSHRFLTIIKDGVYVSDHWPVVSQVVPR